MTTQIVRASLPARVTQLSSSTIALHSLSRHGYLTSPFILKSRSFGTSPACRATHYDALGLPRGASKREIKTAFYKVRVFILWLHLLCSYRTFFVEQLSKELHPDRNPDADQASKEKYLKASEAYATLVDDRKRYATPLFR